MLPILTDMRTVGAVLDRKHGVVVHVTANAPPGRARTKAAQQFWTEGKRLIARGLVAVINKKHGRLASVTLATIATCEFASA